MNFINEHDGLPLAQSELILGLLDHLSDVIGGRAGGRQTDKTSRSLLFTGAGNYVSQSGLKDKINTYKYIGLKQCLSSKIFGF